MPSYYPSGDNEVESPWSNADTLPPLKPDIESTLPPTTPTTTTTTTTTTTSTTTTSTTTTTTTPSPIVIDEEKEIEAKTPQKILTTRPPAKLNLPSDERCKLPEQPNFDVDFTEAGYRFYGLREQRLQINSLPVKVRRHHDIGISFRTERPNGLLIYAGSKQRDDFIAVYLLDGRVTYEIRVGAQLQAKITTEAELNDGTWHTVEVVRTQRKVSLLIDKLEQPGSVDLNAERSAPVLAVELPIYLGGVNKFLESEVKNLTDFKTEVPYFNGCLKNIKFDAMDLETPPEEFGVVPCSEQVERGLFFNNQKAFVKIFDHFDVGTEMKISFDFRPRDPNGLLFSVHGKNSYAILELVDNTLYFTVKTDLKNIVSTNYKLPNNESFCDGKTRNVQAIKSKFVINIAVDFISSNPGVGNEGSVITRTNRPLFLGGHVAFQRAPGIKTKKSFKGCISKVEVNQRMINITPNMVVGDIWQGYCPLN